ncbi:unnamed protein product [Candida parapsilosis]
MLASSTGVHHNFQFKFYKVAQFRYLFTRLQANTKAQYLPKENQLVAHNSNHYNRYTSPAVVSLNSKIIHYSSSAFRNNSGHIQARS